MYHDVCFNGFFSGSHASVVTSRCLQKWQYSHLAGPNGWCNLPGPTKQAELWATLKNHHCSTSYQIIQTQTMMKTGRMHGFCLAMRQQQLGIIAFSRLDPDASAMSRLCRAQVLSNAFEAGYLRLYRDMLSSIYHSSIYTSNYILYWQMMSII